MIESMSTDRTQNSSRDETAFHTISIQIYDSMASMTVKVVSKKLVKPSNPTTHDLGNLKLSLFDQLAPRIYTDVIFYYLGSEDGSCRAESDKRIAQLEKSLSETLTFFYPLAGRFVQSDVSIDCGDQGVEYFEAQVNGKLAKFLHDEPQIELLNKFLPWNSPPAANLATSPLLAIQINSFDCGGIVLGIRISHIIADGSTIFRFISEWATNNRTRIHRVLSPSLSYGQFASLFPARQFLSGTKLTQEASSKPPQPAENGGKFIARRFLFDETVISNIRDQAASSLKYKPTRVVVVIALIWKALMGVAQAKHGHLRNYVLTVAMNLRGKESLQLQELNYGNFWIPVPVSFLASEAKMGLQNLISLLGDTIRDTKEKLANASSEEISSMLINFRRELVEKRRQTDAWDAYIFSSWCKFPLYEADFGWGKPFWVSSATTESFEVSWLMDTRNGGRIEVWINLKEKDMLEFEQDPDILALVSKQ